MLKHTPEEAEFQRLAQIAQDAAATSDDPQAQMMFALFKGIQIERMQRIEEIARLEGLLEAAERKGLALQQ